MNQLEKKEPVQAILIDDNFNDCFVPITDRKPLPLLPLVNVPLLDYALESLNRSGVEEIFLFCSNHVEQVRAYVHRQQQINRCSWSIGMSVTIVSSEGCRCMGDALRDLYGKQLVRGNFILMGVDTVTNANLAAILEEHKQLTMTDKGAVMTVVFKEGFQQQRTGREVLIAMDKTTRQLLSHQRLKPQHKESKFSIPLQVFLQNKDVTMLHGLLDPQIAICSSSVLPLFLDNFDFLTRDDFIRGLLNNEEVLDSTIYVSQLPREEYAAKVNNWQSYQIVSRDVANRYVYPLVPDMGVCGNEQHYSFCRNNIYRSRDLRLARSSVLKSDVVVGEQCFIDEKTVVEHSVLGKGCKVGKNCRISNSFILDHVRIGDNCELDHCIVGEMAEIEQNCKLSDGCILGPDVVLPKATIISKVSLQSTKPDNTWTEGSKEMGAQAFTVPDLAENAMDDPLANSDDDDDQANTINHAMRLSCLERAVSPSIYSSSSEEGESRGMSPIQEDANIFLSEVLESLKRGYSERSNPDYLILEINSSRYAYNMSLSEVNFYVVKAILQLLTMQENAAGGAVVTLLNQLLSYFGPVFKNYIRGRDAMMDALKALEESAQQDEVIRTKIAKLVHYLYERDFVTEEVILEWHEEMEDDGEGSVKRSLAKLVDWLMQSSEEDDDEDESE
ncbi:translation initiation factor eIF-2B subunit epsilon [Topomyia yanbarensis]|uniref:translation initiation factor eIF-2B subunit epsilon n=1 Tax=Topomyia yanbarensis TaxID=2498891 RepID=UPI00273A9A94|nr:translation initiation factor eIF-2B subunit epsilon [Topomyia yanbarensis]